MENKEMGKQGNGFSTNRNFNEVNTVCFILLGIMSKLSPGWSCLWEVNLTNYQRIGKKESPDFQHHHDSLWKTHKIPNKTNCCKKHVHKFLCHISCFYVLLHAFAATWFLSLCLSLAVSLLESVKLQRQRKRLLVI